MSIVGDRLRRLRTDSMLSQKQLALKLGITQSAVNRYENNLSEASYKTLTLYADYFDVSMDYIYGRTDKPQGRLYDYNPRIEDSEDLKLFIEMCFDPESPMNEKLKHSLISMVGEAKREYKRK